MSIPTLAPYTMPTQTIPNKVDWTPEAPRAALLIHDMQDYFLDKYDVQAAPIPDLLDNISRLRAQCDLAGIPVFYTAQPIDQAPADRALLNDFWGPGLTAPQYHARQGITARLAPRPTDTVLTKWRYSAFQRSDLRERLRALGRDQLIITGVYAHIGCMATALEAFMQDIQAFMAIDACADFSADEHLMAMRHVAGRCGVCLQTDALCAALRASTAVA